MKINQVLVESAGATVAFAFGRFNPAHQGHIEVWRAVEQAGANWFIGTNPSTLGPNDPLTFQQKSAWMAEIYPPISGHIVAEQSVLTLAAYIFKKTRKNESATVAYITDAADWAWSGKLLNQYNGVEGAHGYYKFAQITHVPSPRVSSATALRDAARADDKVAFYHASGTDPKSKVAGLTYFDTVKQAVEKYPLPVKKAKKVKEQGVAEGSEHYDGIEISMEKEDDEIMVKAMMSGGRELGHVLFVIDGEYLAPQDLEVDERYQGQGIAATMYDYVKSKGYKIRRSGQQTDAGAGFWDKHKPGKNVWEQGVAEDSSQKTFTVVYYSKKTDRNVTKTIKANNQSQVWDKLKSKGIDVVSVKEQGLNEFAPGSGGGESGRWYTDDQLTDLVGDGWWNDLDISGDISKQEMIQEAQAWLDDQGYSVQVLNCKVNDDNMEWYIEGSFHNSGFAKKGVAEDEQKTQAKTWDQMTAQEKISGVKGRTLWNEKTKKYYTVFDVPATVKEDEEAGEVEKTGQLIPFPAGTTKVSVSDVYDWYKLGQVISDLDDANPADFGQGAPETVIAFGSEEEENKLLPLLQRLGLKLKDIDQPVSEAYHAGSLYEMLKKERTKNWALINKSTA